MKICFAGLDLHDHDNDIALKYVTVSWVFEDPLSSHYEALFLKNIVFI